jgi:hypothetical protein
VEVFTGTARLCDNQWVARGLTGRIVCEGV